MNPAIQHVRNKTVAVCFPQISDVREWKSCPMKENNSLVKEEGLRTHAEMMGLLSGVQASKYVKNLFSQ